MLISWALFNRNTILLNEKRGRTTQRLIPLILYGEATIQQLRQLPHSQKQIGD